MSIQLDKTDKKDNEHPKVENPSINKAERESRILYLNDPIDKDTAYKINRALLLLDEDNQKPIKLFVNSPGGEVNSGFFIFDCIKFIRSPVYIIGAGLVASAAALIYLAVDKKYRISLPHARFMLHQPLSGMRGVVTDLEIHAKEVDDLKLLINKIIAEATDTSLKKVEQDTDRDFWLNAEQAKNYGLVHKIISHKDEMAELFPIRTDKEAKNETSSKKKTSAKSSPSSKKPSAKASSTKASDTSSSKSKTAPKANSNTKSTTPKSTGKSSGSDKKKNK